MPSRAVHLPGQVEWVGVSGRNRGGSFVVPQRKPSGNVKGTRLLYSYYVVVVVVASKAYVNRVNIFRSIFHFFRGEKCARIPLDRPEFETRRFSFPETKNLKLKTSVFHGPTVSALNGSSLATTLIHLLIFLC